MRGCSRRENNGKWLGEGCGFGQGLGGGCVEGWLEGGGEGMREMVERGPWRCSHTDLSAFSGAREVELVMSQSSAISTSISDGSPSPMGSHRVAVVHPSRGSSSTVGREARQSLGHHLQPRHSILVTHRWWCTHLCKGLVSTGGPQLAWFGWTLPLLHL